MPVPRQATRGGEAVILISLSALSALSAVSQLPPRLRHYRQRLLALDKRNVIVYNPTKRTITHETHKIARAMTESFSVTTSPPFRPFLTGAPLFQCHTPTLAFSPSGQGLQRRRRAVPAGLLDPADSSTPCHQNVPTPFPPAQNRSQKLDFRAPSSILPFAQILTIPRDTNVLPPIPFVTKCSNLLEFPASPRFFSVMATTSVWRLSAQKSSQHSPSFMVILPSRREFQGARRDDGRFETRFAANQRQDEHPPREGRGVEEK